MDKWRWLVISIAVCDLVACAQSRQRDTGDSETDEEISADAGARDASSADAFIAPPQDARLPPGDAPADVLSIDECPPAGSACTVPLERCGHDDWHDVGQMCVGPELVWTSCFVRRGANTDMVQASCPHDEPEPGAPCCDLTRYPLPHCRYTIEGEQTYFQCFESHWQALDYSSP